MRGRRGREKNRGNTDTQKKRKRRERKKRKTSTCRTGARKMERGQSGETRDEHTPKRTPLPCKNGQTSLENSENEIVM